MKALFVLSADAVCTFMTKTYKCAQIEKKNTARNEEQHKKADTSNSGAPYVRASGTDDDCKKFNFDGWNECYGYGQFINMFQYGFLESCNRSSV